MLYPTQMLNQRVAAAAALRYKSMKISELLGETATAGATTAANVGVGAVYNNAPIKQKKNKNGTVTNALDTNTNLMTGGSIKR